MFLLLVLSGIGAYPSVMIIIASGFLFKLFNSSKITLIEVPPPDLLLLKVSFSFLVI